MSSDKHKLIENFISLSGLQLFSTLLPLITLPYVLRVLGLNNYGVIVLAASLVSYFQTLSDYSFRITATRDVAIFNKSQLKLNLIYSKVIIVKSIFLIISYFLIFLIVFFYPPFYEDSLIFILSSAALLGYALFPEWYFQGIEKMKYIAFLNISIKLFFTFCVFIFIKNKNDYWIYPLLHSTGFIIAGLVGQYILLRHYKLRFIWLNKRIVKNTIFKNFPIFINQFFPTLYNNSSVFILGILTSSEIVGSYSAIKKIIDLAVTLLNIFSRVFFPFLNRRKDAFNLFKKLMISISLMLIFTIIVLHKLVFWYLNIEFSNELPVLVILSIGLLGYAFYDIWGLNYFIIKRKDKLVMRNTIIASIIGFILAFPFIYYWGIIGAAIILSLSRWLMGGGLLIEVFKEKYNENRNS